MPPAISFRQVSKEFRSEGKAVLRAVDSVDLDIEHGRIAGIIGYSGAGKSTLVRLVNGLETPTRGTVVVNGKDLAELSAKGMRELRGGVGMIFQQFNLFSSRTAAGNVAYPLKLAGWPRQRRAERVAELLDFVGIADKARQYPSQLSGGQKQRVGIARALATSPTILLADEATSALDPETTRDVLALLKTVAYMDDPHGRSKDLEDLDRLMEQYELEGERRFGEDVFEAGADFESAGAFLLGLDVGRLCTGGEAKIVGNLIAALQDDSRPAQRLLGRGRVEESVIEETKKRSEAFAAGFVIGQRQSHNL